MNTNTFRTIYKPVPFNFNINYRSEILFTGSCFTENIGRKLEELKFDVIINPFGIVYNPISVVQSLNFIFENKQFREDDLIYYNEYWHSFFHHGKFSDTDKQKTLQIINKSVNKSHNFIKNADFLFVTFGTAWVYILKKNGQIVANCHKLPASEFDKKCLTENEIATVFNEFITKLRTVNKKIKIVFSVSPVRHLKYGLSENFISKSILRTSIEKIKKSNSEIYYFPAFEILNDDLRDYRFYDKDLVHPNETATDYIFEVFKDTFFTEETKIIIKDVKKIISARNHKIFNPETVQSKKFIDFVLTEIDKLTKKYPFLSFEQEKQYFEDLK